MTALSIDECVWSEQYTAVRGISARPASPFARTSATAVSRAATIACIVAIDAVS